MEPEDLELLYRIENDPSFWRFGTTSVPYSRWTLRRYIESSTSDLFSDQQVRFVIETTDTQGNTIALGLADLVNFSPLHQRAEISLAVLPEYQGHHIAEHAVRQLLDYARQLHIHQLYAIIATTNEPASRLFQKMGFSQTSLLKDWIFCENAYLDAHVWQKNT